MSSIARAVSPHVTEPPEGTWSNCLVANGIAYIAGMTASGGDLSDEYTQAKAIFAKIRSEISFMDNDRPLDTDIAAVSELIRNQLIPLPD